MSGQQQERVREVSWGAGRVDAGPPIGTNGWARWSAIFGVIGLAPLGFGFGVVGLVQTRRSGQPGKRLAVLGLTASVVWTAIVVSVGGLPGMGADRGANGQVIGKSEVSVFDVQVGDCFRWGVAEPDSQVEMVTLVPCAQQHDAKVFAEPMIGLMDDSAVQAAAQQACATTSDAKAMPGTGSWSFMFPAHTSLAKESRKVICYTTS